MPSTPGSRGRYGGRYGGKRSWRGAWDGLGDARWPSAGALQQRRRRLGFLDDGQGRSGAER